MADYISRRLKDEEERLLNVMKTMKMSTHHVESSGFSFSKSHDKTSRDITVNVASHIDSKQFQTVDHSDLRANSLIIDLEDAVRKKDLEISELRRTVEALKSTDDKYSTFRKTVTYYSSMLFDIVGGENAIEDDCGPSAPPNGSGASLSSVPEYHSTAHERQSYIRNLITGLKLFTATFDVPVQSEDLALGVSRTADMVTASFTMADTLSNHRKTKHTRRVSLLSGKGPVTQNLSFIPLSHHAEISMLKTFKLFLFAEQQLVDALPQKQTIRGDGTADHHSSMVVDTKVDVTDDEWIGLRAVLTTLFVTNIFDGRLTLEKASMAFELAAQESERATTKFSRRLQINEFVYLLALLARYKYSDLAAASDTVCAEKMLKYVSSHLEAFDSASGRDVLLCNLRVFYPASNSFVFAKLVEHQSMLYNRFLHAVNYGVFNVSLEHPTIQSVTQAPGSSSSVVSGHPSSPSPSVQVNNFTSPVRRQSVAVGFSQNSPEGDLKFASPSRRQSVAIGPNNFRMPEAEIGYSSSPSLFGRQQALHRSPEGDGMSVISDLAASNASVSPSRVFGGKLSTPRGNKAAALRRSSVIGESQPVTASTAFSMSSAPRFHGDESETSSKVLAAKAVAGTKAFSVSTSTAAAQMKARNAFELFCIQYRIVPELINEAFPRRISQFMRAFNDSKFPYFIGCLIYLAVTMTEEDFTEDSERQKRDWHKVASALEVIAMHVFVKSSGGSDY